MTSTADAPVDSTRDLSVIVASVESTRRIRRALESLLTATAGLRAEVIVVDAANDGSVEQAAQIQGVQVYRRPVGKLVPYLWAEGIRRARGRVVATTTAHTVVGTEWAAALVSAFDDPRVGGAGGPLRLAPDASAIDAAVFFLRYSAFLPSCLPEGVTTGELAGDNAAYLRADLLSDPHILEDGFWEVSYHQRLRAQGRLLVGRLEAVAAFGHAYPFGVIARHRFQHGRRFAAERISSNTRSRWRVLAAAPGVPIVLAARAVRRAYADSEHRGRVATALPGLLALAGAWAAGEAAGALAGPGAGEHRRAVHE